VASTGKSNQNAASEGTPEATTEETATQQAPDKQGAKYSHHQENSNSNGLA
jgi:hypothetical protein